MQVFGWWSLAMVKMLVVMMTMVTVVVVMMVVRWVIHRFKC